MVGSEGTAIWTRKIDEGAIAKRWRGFVVYYAVPSFIAAVLAFIVGGVGPFLGVFILVCLFGMLLAAWFWSLAASARQNREIRLSEGQLAVGNKSVQASTVESWTTTMASQSSPLGGMGSLALAKVLFRVPVLRDGQRGVRPDGGPAFQVIELAWASMSESELEGVRAALSPHVLAPWVTLDHLRD